MRIRSKFKKIPVTLFCIITLTNCTVDRETSINKYFNLQAFLNDQISLLNKDNSNISKTLKFDESIESQTIENIDSVIWHKELKIFREHDINRPVLVDAYEIVNSAGSKGGRVESYKLIDDTQNGILDMEIAYLPDGEVSSWRSTFREENLLYSNFREASMTMGQQGKLSSYEITGYHKLMFKDTVHYHIEVEIY